MEPENKGVKKGSDGAETAILDLLWRGRFLDCGELFVSRTTSGRKRPGQRFLIYLPTNRNYVWKLLHEKKVRLRIYIELPKES
jgi:hypothetical protein